MISRNGQAPKSPQWLRSLSATQRFQELHHFRATFLVPQVGRTQGSRTKEPHHGAA